MKLDFLINILLSDEPSKNIKFNEKQIFEMIPELSACKNFNQNNIWHIYDVYDHILHVVDGVPNSLALRMAALFHDIGKPFVYIEDENGIGHFYDHWNKSNEIFLNFISQSDYKDFKEKYMLQINQLNIEKEELLKNKINSLININSKFKSEYKTYLGILKINNML